MCTGCVNGVECYRLSLPQGYKRGVNIKNMRHYAFSFYEK
jgi:hypothetical protein